MRKLTKTAAVVASMAVMAMGATVMTSAAQEGWVQKGSDWYFYVNGNAVENQWALAGEKWYFLGDDGKMIKNAFINSDKEEVDDIDDLPEGGDSDDPVYYVGADGAMVTGWKEIDINTIGASETPKSSKKWYYFGGSGMMFGKQWVQAGEKWYYLGANGQMVKNNWDDDEDYYLGKDGVMISGWYKLTKDDGDLGNEDEWVYADDDEIIENGWKKIDGKWYLFGDVDIASDTVSGAAAVGSASTTYAMNEEVAVNKGGKWYYLKKNGSMETGWFSVKVDKKTYKYYAGSDGEIKCNGQISGVSGKNYYFYNTNIGDDVYVGKYLDSKYVVEYETTENGKTVKKVLMNADGTCLLYTSDAADD